MCPRGLTKAHWIFRSNAIVQITNGYTAKSQRCFTLSPNVWNDSKQRWSTEEDELILRLRETGKMPEEILTHLPERSLSAIENRMYGPLRTKLVERGLLAKFQPRLSMDEIKRIRSLRSQHVRWRDILQEYPGRSYQAILASLRSASEQHPLVGQRRRRKFEDWEDELLLRYRRDESMHWPEICEKLSHRTPKTIWNRYRKLVHANNRIFIPRSNLYTPSEVSELIKLRNEGMTWAEIAQYLGKTNTFGVKMRYLNEKYFSDVKPKQGRWTEDEDRKLLSLRRSGQRGWLEHAIQELGRSPDAINYRDWVLKTEKARRSSNNSKDIKS